MNPNPVPGTTGTSKTIQQGTNADDQLEEEVAFNEQVNRTEMDTTDSTN
jgi:hypothetical protein